MESTAETVTITRELRIDASPETVWEFDEHGWDHYLERLLIAARGDDAGPDPWLSGEM